MFLNLLDLHQFDRRHQRTTYHHEVILHVVTVFGLGIRYELNLSPGWPSTPGTPSLTEIFCLLAAIFTVSTSGPASRDHLTVGRQQCAVFTVNTDLTSIAPSLPSLPTTTLSALRFYQV